MTATRIRSQAMAVRAVHPNIDLRAATPVIAAGLVALCAVWIIAQTSDPLAYLVGLAPIAWIAIEGAWRLLADPR